MYLNLSRTRTLDNSICGAPSNSMDTLLPVVDTLAMSNDHVEVSPSGYCIVVCFGNRAVWKWLITDSSQANINSNKFLWLEILFFQLGVTVLESG